MMGGPADGAGTAVARANSADMDGFHYEALMGAAADKRPLSVHF